MDNWIATNKDLIPDFIIGGAMKSGTSTLHEILNKHPRVFIPKGEIYFFDIDNILQHNDFNFHINDQWISQSMDENPKLMWDWYYNKFKGNETLLKGEDSTTYLASSIAAKRIAQQEKDIKLIFLLRQPTLRTYSQYNHLLRTGRATYNFEDSLRYNPYQVIDRSLYKEQIENYYKYIPKSRIKIILFEDLTANIETVLREVAMFLDIEYNEFPKDIFSTHANKARMPKNINWQVKRNAWLRSFGNARYNNQLPFKVSDKKSSEPFMAKALNAVHSKMNPLLSIKPPQIKPETKLFLDNYFYRELQGLDELVGKEILPIWFPAQAKRS